VTSELVVGAGLETADIVFNVGPQHPSTHGVLRLKLVLDGERVPGPARRGRIAAYRGFRDGDV
jgi:hypothetical protein